MTRWRWRGHGCLWWIGMAVLGYIVVVGFLSCGYALLKYG